MASTDYYFNLVLENHSLASVNCKKELSACVLTVCSDYVITTGHYYRRNFEVYTQVRSTIVDWFSEYNEIIKQCFQCFDYARILYYAPVSAFNDFLQVILWFLFVSIYDFY